MIDQHVVCEPDEKQVIIYWYISCGGVCSATCIKLATWINSKYHKCSKFWNTFLFLFSIICWGAQWLSGRVLDSRPKGCRFEPHWHHCVVSLSKNINSSLVLVRPRKARPYIIERLLMGRKESNQTKQTNNHMLVFRAGTHKMLVKIANREDQDQTASSEAV